MSKESPKLPATRSELTFPQEREIYDKGFTIIVKKIQNETQDEFVNLVMTATDSRNLPTAKAYPDIKHIGSKNTKDMKVVWRFIEMVTGFSFKPETVGKNFEVVADSMIKAKEIWKELYFEEFHDSTIDDVINILTDQTLKKDKQAKFNCDATKSGKMNYETKKQALEVLFRKAPAFGSKNDNYESRRICTFLKLTDACMESKKLEFRSLKNDGIEFEKQIFDKKSITIKKPEECMEITKMKAQLEYLQSQLELLKKSHQTAKSNEKSDIKKVLSHLNTDIKDVEERIFAKRAKMINSQSSKNEYFMKFERKEFWLESRFKNENDLIMKIARESGFSAKNIDTTGKVLKQEKVTDQIGLRIEAESAEHVKKLIISLMTEKIMQISGNKQTYNFELINTNLLSNNDIEDIQKPIKINKELKTIPFEKIEQRSGGNKKAGSHEKFTNTKIIGKFFIEGRERTFEIQFVIVGNENETHLSHHAVFRAKQNLMLINRLDGYIREGVVMQHITNAAVNSFEKDPSKDRLGFEEWRETVKRHIYEDHLELITAEEAGFSEPRFYRFIKDKD